MIDSEDYKEPSCLLCGGKEFYNPIKNEPKGRIPVMRVIEKVNAYFDKNDYIGAGELLEFWEKEAKDLGDESGELSILSELIGFYRKTNNKEKAETVCLRAEELINKLELRGTVSAATVYLNIATAKKAFGDPETAADFYGKTLEIYNQKLDKNDVKFAGLYNNFALALVDLERYNDAENYYLLAIEITKNAENGLPDCAISYVNLAHLYYEAGENKDKIDDCMFNAYNLLNDEKVAQNGYLAYVLEKCAPSFGFFGFSLIEKEFNAKSKELYERS